MSTPFPPSLYVSASSRYVQAEPRPSTLIVRRWSTWVHRSLPPAASPGWPASPGTGRAAEVYIAAGVVAAEPGRQLAPLESYLAFISPESAHLLIRHLLLLLKLVVMCLLCILVSLGVRVRRLHGQRNRTVSTIVVLLSRLRGPRRHRAVHGGRGRLLRRRRRRRGVSAVVYSGFDIHGTGQSRRSGAR